MHNLFYLYCNSPASSAQGVGGFIRRDKPFNRRKPGHLYKQCNVTSEYCCAIEFKSKEDAERFIMKHDMPAIIFQRVDY